MENPSSAPLRLGFIGASFIAQVTHLPSFAAIPGVHIRAIADPRLGLREAVAQQFGATAVSHHEAILNDPAIDAVVISVYRRCQAPLAAQALAAGKPVFSEKPLAYSHAEAAKNVALAEAGNLPYAVGYMKRFDAGVRQFKRLLQDTIASGELGELLHVQVRDCCPANDIAPPPHIKPFFPSEYRYDVSPPGPDGLPSEYVADYDYTLNVISHDINLLYFLFGPIFKAERLAVRSRRMQTAQLSAPDFDVSLTAGLSDKGTWDQEIELFFRKGRMRLVLPSPMDRSGVAATLMNGERLQPQGPWAFAAQAEHVAGAFRRANALDCPARNVLADLYLIESLWERAAWHP
jgi:predicted dehydrogenase